MYKRVVIMSTLFVSLILVLFTSDIVTSNITYNELDTLSSEVGFYISKSGGITETIKNYVKKEADATIKCADDECVKPKVGDTYFYIIYKEYSPIILKNVKQISIKRSVVITF